MRNLKINGLARLKGTLLFKTTTNQSWISCKGQVMKAIFVFWYNLKIMNPFLGLPGFLLIIHILILISSYVYNTQLIQWHFLEYITFIVIHSYNITSMREPKK